MANICSFEMKVKGKKEDIEQFCKAMTYEGKIRIGGGAEIQVSFEDDNVADLSGYAIYEYKTKEEAERNLEVEITDNEWESGEEYIQRGGFEEWNFDLSFSEEIHKEKKNLKQNKKKETERDDR